MTDRRIVIVGFMGCGKTTVAKALARQLGCAMVDLDSFITDREGHTPAEIIVQDSELSFREIETRALEVVLHESAARVIALGGGAWMIQANRALVEEHDCLSVWLDAPFELCWERISRNAGASRPLAPDRDTASQRFEARRADYVLAEQHLNVDASDSTQELVERILSQP